MKFTLTKSLYFLILITGYSIQVKGQKFHAVPTQELELYQLLGKDDHTKDTVEAFEISDFITYKEYKKYLKEIQVDSSEQFYISQFPDTNITIDKNIYRKYLTSKEYDKYPVL